MEHKRSWFVLIAAYIALFIISSASYMYGILYVELLERFSEGAAKTSLIGSLHGGLTCLCGPFVSVLVDTYSCRTSMLLGGSVLCLAFFISAFINSIDLLIVTIGVFGGIGTSLVLIPSVVVVGHYFQKRRNLVMSCSMVVAGLAMLTTTPLTMLLLGNFSIHGTFLILCGINGNIIVCALICKPSTLEIEAKLARNRDYKTDSHISEYRTCLGKILKLISNKFNVHLLQSSRFMLFQISTFTWNFVLTLGLMHLPNYVVLKGGGNIGIATIMTILTLSNATGRALGTLSIDKVESVRLHNLMLGLCGIITVAFPAYNSLHHAEYVLAAWIGLCTGIPNTLMSPISLKLAGIDNMTSSQGFMFFFCGLGAMAGPPIAGFVYESSDSYNISFIIAGCVSSFGCVVGILSSLQTSTNGSDAVTSLVINVDLDLHLKETRMGTSLDSDESVEVSLVQGTSDA